MGINDAMDISVSGIRANRLQMEIIASNLANVQSTRSLRGGAYRRKIPVISEQPLSFERIYEREVEQQIGGVKVVDVLDDPAPPAKVYNPNHPDADKDGYVYMPNISLSQEMTDMIFATRLYEANVNVFNASKKMAQDTLQIQ